MALSSIPLRDVSTLLHRRFPDEQPHWVGPHTESTNLIPKGTRVVVLNDVLGDLHDIWDFLRALRTQGSDETQVVLVHSSSYWKQFASVLGSGRGSPDQRPPSWLSHLDIENLLALNGFEIVSFEDRVLFPWKIPGLDFLFNRILVTLPILHMLALVRVYFLRPSRNHPVRTSPAGGPSVSVIVPARDERGNIDRCIAELPVLGDRTELIFVEGGSKDGTREAIEQAMTTYRGPLEIKLVPQTKADGKGGAVRLGFEEATGDILMILDSDLTVIPKDLPKFYLAMVENTGDFIMGSRLVYPLEQQAMRTLNIFGNKFFSLLFSWLLSRPIKDTLCGTKVLWKKDYERIKRNRHVFGDFDPFGDYDLIFGAALLNLKIVEIPVRYHARTYGVTKISRFTHGWLLLQMCLFAFRHFKLR